MSDLGRVINSYLRRRKADGGEVTADDMIGRAREELAKPAPPATTDADAAPAAGVFDKVRGALSAANDVAKRFTNYDRQFTEDMINLPRRIYQNPDAFRKGLQNVMGGDTENERTQLWPEKMVRSGFTLAHDVGTGEVPMNVPDPVTGEMVTNPQVIERAQDMAGLAGGQTLLAGARDAAATAGRDARILGKQVLAADSQAVGAPLAALEHAPKFYSALEHAVEALPEQTMTGSQWLSRVWEPESTKTVGVRGPDNKVMIDPETGQPVTKQVQVQGRSPLEGVKQEELEHSGLTKFLADNADRPVTKAEVQEHLGANKLELGETSYGTGSHREVLQAANEALQREYHRVDSAPRTAETEAKLNSIANQMEDNLRAMEDEVSGTQYHEYQLPGGENYREKLLKLPTPNDRYIAATDAMRQKYGDMPLGQMPMTDAERAVIDRHINAYGDTGGTYKSSHWPWDPNTLVHRRTNDREMAVPFTPEEQAALAAHEEAKPKIEALRQQQDDVVRQIRNTAKPLEQARKDQIIADVKAGKISSGDGLRALQEYVDHPEIKPLQDRLESLRAAERELLPDEPLPKPKSAKSLHIEEIQSDWHQQGRRQGYKGDVDVAALERKANVSYQNLIAEIRRSQPEISKQVADKLATELLENVKNGESRGSLYNNAEWEMAQKWHADREAYLSAGTKMSAVPNAPFRKNWHDLALKDAIREAAEKGFDRISWTPGEAQAARYDLSKQIKALHYVKTSRGEYMLAPEAHSGSEVPVNHGQPIPADKLADYIGKDVAEKIIKGEGKTGEDAGTLTGLDLKIGGEGMKGFYDKIIPDAMNKIGKPHGVKVEKGEIEHEGSRAAFNAAMRSGDSEAIAKASAMQKSPVHYMDIPQSLKDQALKKGFALFEDSATAGAPLSALEQGYTGPWYHGGERMDRFTEKGKIDPKRATSGPMPFFTDNPEIASNYAKGKPDTSRFDEGNVADYFQVTPKQLGMSGRTPMSVERSWNFLPEQTRQEIRAKATRVGHEIVDEARGPYVLHPEGVDATGASADHWNYIMKHEAKGNPLAALRDLWHDSGRLVDSPGELAEIYRLAGYPHQISEANAPWTEAKGVFPGMLRMHKPLQTDDAKLMTETVLPALQDAFKRDRSRTKAYGADMWDKSTRYTPREWVKQAMEDYAKGDNSFVWTSIPDKVTAELRKLGFDGIIDTGGKMGGHGHKVAVPFGPEQVRSTFAKFDPKKVGQNGLLLQDAVTAGAPASALEKKDKAMSYPTILQHFAEGGDVDEPAPPSFDPSRLKPAPQAAAAVPSSFDPTKLKAKTEGPMSAMDVASGAVENAPASAWQFMKDVAQPVIHPIDTMRGIKDLGLGLLEKSGAIGTIFPSAGGGHEQVADAMGQYLKDRYGSLENVKKSIAKDPVGVLSDASMILTGGGSAAARLPGIAGRAGEIAGTVGRAVDPLMAPVNAAKAGTGVVGNLLTHTGAAPLENAYKAGVEGGEAGDVFRGHMRGTADSVEPVIMAKQGLAGYRAQRGKDYREGMGDITSVDRQMAPADRVLDFSKIDDAVDKAERLHKFGVMDINEPAAAVRADMMDKIEKWKTLPPADYHTIEGLDALKKSLGQVMMAQAPGTPARTAASEIYNAVRKTIVDYDPKYASVMQDYEKASTQIKELERAMSLGEKASADTALRKLQSIMRNNVNTNYGRRLELGKLLEENGATHLMAALSGQSLNAWFPRGLGKLGAELGLLAGIGTAGHAAGATAGLGLLAAPFMSPRLMGEVAHGAGRTVGRGLDATSRVLSGIGGNRAAGNIAYRAGRATNPFENAPPPNPYAP